MYILNCRSWCGTIKTNVCCGREREECCTSVSAGLAGEQSTVRSPLLSYLAFLSWVLTGPSQKARHEMNQN